MPAFGCSPYLRRYKTCTSAEGVAVMQDTIIAELEESYDVSRRKKGIIITFIYVVLISDVWKKKMGILRIFSCGILIISCPVVMMEQALYRRVMKSNIYSPPRILYRASGYGTVVLPRLKTDFFFEMDVAS